MLAKTRDIKGKVRCHKYLLTVLSRMVPAVSMVATSCLWYSVPLFPWTDAELDHRVWLQVQRARPGGTRCRGPGGCGAGRGLEALEALPGGLEAASWPPSCTALVRQRCSEAHPVVPMIQALAKHMEQLVALPDELRLTTVRKFKTLCDSCICHNERELASYLAEERRLQA